MQFNIRRNDDENNENNEKKKSHWWKWVLLIIIIIIIILLLLRSCGKAEPGIVVDPTVAPTVEVIAPTTQPVPDIDPNAGEYVPPVVAAPGEIKIPGWGTLTIPPNTKENIRVDFHNPIENADRYYLQYELRLLDDSEKGYETLYTSGLIEPGLHVQSISLSRGLPEGEYDIILYVQPYRMSDKALTNNVELTAKLIVQ